MFPESFKAYEKKGNVFYEMKDFEQAVKNYEKCIEINEASKDLKKYKDALDFIKSKTKSNECLEEINVISSKAPCINKFIKFMDLEGDYYIYQCLKCNAVSFIFTLYILKKFLFILNRF